MIEEFANHSAFSVLILSHDTAPIYDKLSAFASGPRDISRNAIYFTLNCNDYRFKYETLFGRNSNNKRFWSQFKTKYSSFIGMDLSAESEQQLNDFYNATTCQLMTERQCKHIKSCCIPMCTYLNE